MSVRFSTRAFVPHAADYVSVRLQGTVWARITSAHALYRALLAFGMALGRVGITANGMTYASLALAALSGFALCLGHFAWAAVLVVLSGACDMLDGVIARSTNSVSRFGALLDSTMDRLADGFPLLGLAVFYSGSKTLVAVPVLAILGAFTVSYVRARAQGLGAELPPLFMRRAERVTLLVVSLLAGVVVLPSVPMAAPLTLLGVSLLALLNVFGCVAALRAAQGALADPAVSVSRGVAAGERQAQP